jgi:hypothetical protein
MCRAPRQCREQRASTDRAKQLERMISSHDPFAGAGYVNARLEAIQSGPQCEYYELQKRNSNEPISCNHLVLKKALGD